MLTVISEPDMVLDNEPTQPEKVPKPGKGWWKVPLSYTLVGAAVGVSIVSTFWYQSIGTQLNQIKQQIPRPGLHDVVAYTNGHRVHFTEPAGATVVAVSQAPQGSQSSCEIWVDGIKVVWHTEYQGGFAQCSYLVGSEE